jgi:hypothetical protein
VVRPVKFGIFDGKPGAVRYSTILRRCREQGMTDAYADLKRVKEQFEVCPTHGFMADPVVGVVGTQIAIACPHCSGAHVLAAWEAEGSQVLA